MRKLVMLIVVTFTVAACTPGQVAQFLGHPGTVTKEDVKIASITQEKPQPVPIGATVFLEFADALHNNPFLACTRGHESDTAGGYQAYNPAGPYFGAYQFLQNTWNNAASHAGYPQFVGADILAVNGFYQDSVAYNLYQWQGNAPWGGRC